MVKREEAGSPAYAEHSKSGWERKRLGVGDCPARLRGWGRRMTVVQPVYRIGRKGRRYELEREGLKLARRR